VKNQCFILYIVQASQVFQYFALAGKTESMRCI